ncbi:MAG: CvpA family protein [Candidatus Aadella gelida]|nr:CvpA family protein [Candidatus Aadella gelida]
MSEIFQDINWIDILFVILLMGISYKGSRIGVGGQLISLTCWLVLVFTSVGYYGALSEAIFGFLLQKWAKPISFFSITVVLYIFIKLLEKMFNIAGGEEISPFERICGAFVAALKGFMLLGVVSILIILSPLPGLREDVVLGSRTAIFFVEIDAEIYSRAAKLFGIAKEDRKDDVMSEILSSAL